MSSRRTSPSAVLARGLRLRAPRATIARLLPELVEPVLELGFPCVLAPPPPGPPSERHRADDAEADQREPGDRCPRWPVTTGRRPWLHARVPPRRGARVQRLPGV